VPGHSRVDLRLGWKPSQDFDLSVGVQNLTSRQHQESQSFTDVLREVPRSFTCKAHGNSELLLKNRRCLGSCYQAIEYSIACGKALNL
jgi:hypothetical protein